MYQKLEEFPQPALDECFMRFQEPPLDLSSARPVCCLEQLDPRLIEVATSLYSFYPFKINSAYRSVEYEKSKGRPGTSSHCKGLALDIAVGDHRQRYLLVSELVRLGVRRIGIAKSYIHFDVDPDKSPSIWLYDPSNPSKTF